MKKFISTLMTTTLMALLLTSCSKMVEIKLAPEVKVFLSDNREKTIRLTAADPAYQALNKWLSEHQSGWYPTSGKYPGGVYFLSGDRGIQVTKRRVVIYSTEGDGPQAIFVQEINDSDLRVVKNVGETN